MIFQTVVSLLAAPLLLPKATRFNAGVRNSSPRPTGEACEHMHVMVASKDVGRVRQALIDKPRTTILQCTPLPSDQFVKLKIQFPMGQSSGVIQSIVSCTNHGAIGRVSASQRTRSLSTSSGTLVCQPIARFAPHGQQF